MIKLDTHIHYKPTELYPDSENGDEGFLKYGQIQHGFLISPSFHIVNTINQAGFDYGWMTELSLRTILNKKTSEVVMQNPKRFRGLCGYNSSWRDEIGVVSECLKLPGMVGIKVHSENDGTVATCEPDRFYKLIASIQHLKPIVLWHTTPEQSASDLYYFVRSFPKVTFVFAHSFYSPDFVEEFAEIEKKSAKLQNIFVEVSTIYANKIRLLEPRYVQAWRKFGMRRVLFGSDLGFIQSAELANMVDVYENSTELTSSERDMIFRYNASSLLNRISDPFLKVITSNKAKLSEKNQIETVYTSKH